jgi:hypothetical protein
LESSLCWADKSRARSVETKLALLTPLQRTGNAVHVTQIKIRRINQRAIPFLGPTSNPHKRGFGKRILYGATSLGVVAVGADIPDSTRSTKLSDQSASNRTM